eukprot:772321-Pleurochrysis_carterae.AAC.1
MAERSGKATLKESDSKTGTRARRGHGMRGKCVCVIARRRREDKREENADLARKERKGGKEG